MAPLLDEPQAAVLEAPLKAAPKLIAPEPGEFHQPLLFIALLLT